MGKLTNNNNKIIELGEKLVVELNLSDSNDTLSRWIAHILSRKLDSYNKTKDPKQKSKLEKECIDLILKIWEKRWYLPNGKNPLRNFECLFRLLEQLKENSSQSYYFRNFDSEEIDLSLISNSSNIMVAQQFYKKIAEIDKLTRSIIIYLLKSLTLALKNKEDDTILNLTKYLNEQYDVSTIVTLMIEDNSSLDENMNEEIIPNATQKYTYSKISEFEKLIEIFQSLVSEIKSK